jgi:hypothetical protein
MLLFSVRNKNIKQVTKESYIILKIRYMITISAGNRLKGPGNSRGGESGN